MVCLEIWEQALLLQAVARKALSISSSSKAETSTLSLSSIPQQTCTFPGLATKIITESLLSHTLSQASFCSSWALKGLSDFVLQYPSNSSVLLLHSLSFFFFPTSCIYACCIWIHCETPSLARIALIQNSQTLCTTKWLEDAVFHASCPCTHQDVRPGKIVADAVSLSFYNFLMLQICGRVTDGKTEPTDFWDTNSCLLFLMLGESGGCPWQRTMHAQSPVSTSHCPRAVKRIRLRGAVWSWWIRAKAELKLKVMFREQNKRNPRKDGTDWNTDSAAEGLAETASDSRRES